jgi:hypothetical protein
VSELDRILGKTFPALQAGGRPRRRTALGDFDPATVNTSPGADPGMIYAGGPQTQQAGPAGQVGQELEKKLSKLFDGIDLSKCGPWANPDCLDLISRMLEQTFRNFQLTARPPSYDQPPFVGRPIDVFTPAGGVAVPVGAFVTLVSFQCPPGNWRAEIASVAQGLESVFAFNDVTWRITVDGTPLVPWNAVIGQLWPGPSTPLPTKIHLRGGQIAALQASAAVQSDHFACARLSGWAYPLRANTGDDSARATIVD